MNRAELNEILAKHYELNPGDWWQHKQSKSWVLSHSAVRKIAHLPTVDGLRVVTPSLINTMILKDGDAAKGGVSGPEVVLMGEFQLVDSNRKVIKSVVAIGEANSRNVSESVSFSWAMAHKRMFDRGVLDILAFAELDVYSSNEAETFNDSSQREPIYTKPKVVEPTAPAKPASTPKVEPMVATPEVGAGLDYPDAIIAALKMANGPVSRKWILEKTGLDRGVFGIAINQLIDGDVVVREGEKRGTKYNLFTQVPVLNSEPEPAPEEVVAQAPAPSPPVPSPPKPAPPVNGNMEAAFDEACGHLLRNGLAYMNISKILKDVTGCTDGAEALRIGKITPESIQEIISKGDMWAAKR
jgi:hypothetical protein